MFALSDGATHRRRCMSQGGARVRDRRGDRGCVPLEDDVYGERLADDRAGLLEHPGAGPDLSRIRAVGDVRREGRSGALRAWGHVLRVLGLLGRTLRRPGRVGVRDAAERAVSADRPEARVGVRQRRARVRVWRVRARGHLGRADVRGRYLDRGYRRVPAMR